jgi:hypothetical protein
MSAENKDSIKNADTYEELREQGASKEKAARIANAQARNDQKPSKKGGNRSRYEDRSRADLYAMAQRVGIEGRSQMTKSQLIDALRHH